MHAFNNALPSPDQIISKVFSVATGKPVAEAFLPKDLVSLAPVFGDANGDGTIDVRFIPILRNPLTGKMEAHDAVGPFNVPVTQAVKFSAEILKMVPPGPAKQQVSIAMGMVVGAAGALEQLVIG